MGMRKRQKPQLHKLSAKKMNDFRQNGGPKDEKIHFRAYNFQTN